MSLEGLLLNKVPAIWIQFLNLADRTFWLNKLTLAMASKLTASFEVWNPTFSHFGQGLITYCPCYA